ncbi:MAG: hypothetical protein EOO07_05175 [Chitinophagaceae bacterium]|nr:MAG: hypothetical protein EOO07_05175 [Chitinophagaceae bacterium]
MLAATETKQVIYAKDRAEWRNWLEKNSQSEKSVWLIIQHKKSKIPGVNLNDATEEALCFGWIDSLAKRNDEQSYGLTFTPRNAKSNWSKPNRNRVEKLLKEGLMTEHGQKMIDIAKKTGRWEPVEKKK